MFRYIVHKEVDKALTIQLNTINKKHLEDKQILLSSKEKSEQDLKDNFSKREKELKDELQSNTTRLSNTISWLRKQSNSTKTRSDISNTSPTEQNKSGEIIGRLSVTDGEELATYGTITEELKLSLIQCYADYDKAKETLDRFKKENTSRTH